MTDGLGLDAAAFFSALIISGLAASPVLSLLRKWKSRQTVSQYAPESHQQKQGTPTMGGLMVLVGAVVSFIVITVLAPHGNLPVFVCSIILLVLFGLIGFADDYLVPHLMPGKRGLGWKQKLLMEAVAAIAAGVWLMWADHSAAEAGSQWIHLAGFVFLILFFCNAYNFADGLDGLAASLGLALFVPFGLIGLSPIGWSMAGALIPFLFLNRHPAKVFMGDVGSLPIGAVLGLLIFEAAAFPEASLAALDLHSTSAYGMTLSFHSPVGWIWGLSLVVLSGMMIAELLPGPLQILSVKLRKKKLFPYTPIHHAFEKAGWPETKVTRTFLAWQIGMSVVFIALVLTAVSK